VPWYSGNEFYDDKDDDDDDDDDDNNDDGLSMMIIHSRWVIAVAGCRYRCKHR